MSWKAIIGGLSAFISPLVSRPRRGFRVPHIASDERRSATSGHRVTLGSELKEGGGGPSVSMVVLEEREEHLKRR